MIDNERLKQYGEPGLIPKAITIHNTNNYTQSARELHDFMNSENETSQGCHFFVDYKEVVQTMPLDWKTWHTGKGNDWAFNNSIAIEICSNANRERYLKGEKRAMKLCRELMKQFGIKKEDIYYHNDFNPRAYCPVNIMSRFKTKADFINKYLKGVD